MASSANSVRQLDKETTRGSGAEKLPDYFADAGESCVEFGLTMGVVFAASFGDFRLAAA